MEILEIGPIVYKVLRAFCQAIGDDSQAEWDDLAQDERELIMEVVMFHMNNPDTSASAGHERWLQNKRISGWKHGPTEDDELKTHPDFLPFVDLPKQQKAKGYIFKAIVNSLT